MFLIKIIFVAVSMLLVGDFLSTFFYHVPEHVFGKFHTIVHHGKNRSFIHYAVLSRNPLVILDGFLGALPYFIFVPWAWQVSPTGTIIALVLGKLHVIWRHVSILDWQTPKGIALCCGWFFIVTPERHWQHHQNSQMAFGDIFTFYHPPAIAWRRFLITVKKKYQKTLNISKA
ncbi:sterol desaturase [Waterburya agarophytonicola K14]|uniref:Sterol desaturase n=1 Tax=Waterburya agarophytonicola KI4 TaxID=2874699 RepID=A0A964FH23_9CYAN|nr:sterol desaturase [Waterburya agarophytonicola KI4]